MVGANGSGDWLPLLLSRVENKQYDGDEWTLIVSFHVGGSRILYDLGKDS